MSLQDTHAIRTAPAATSETLSDKGALRGALGLAIFSLIGLGLLYSLAGVALGQLLFPEAANGSLITHDGRILGSTLVAQPFADARYFQSRPSAAGYNPMVAAGSNQARSNPELRLRIDEARVEVARHNGVAPTSIPADLLTQSASGIDPHVSPQAAAIQVERVMRARGVERHVVEQLVARNTADRQLGLLGQPRVNVLELNLALDALAGSGTGMAAIR